MPDLSEYRQLAKDMSVDAMALVPGPNFTRALGKPFMSHERPFVVVIPAEGAPAAIVPNLELGSWALVGFDGAVFDWRDRQAMTMPLPRWPLICPCHPWRWKGR